MEPGDDFRRVQRSASRPSRIANFSMISAMPLLRTLFYGMSAHAARRIVRRERIGGLLSFYHRKPAAHKWIE